MTTAIEKLVTVTLSNSFHGTSTKVRVPHSWADSQHSVTEYLYIEATNFKATPAAKARFRRVSNALCGISDCCCGGIR